MSNDPKSITDILDRMRDLADDKDQVAVGDVVESMGNRSYGPFLVLLPLIEMSPIGGIPVVPTLLAATIILFGAQILFGRKHMWLPGFLTRRSVSADKVKRSVDKVEPVAKRLDRWFHGRLERFTTGAWVRIAAVLVILLALIVPPLELLPFASTAPMFAILLFGLALLVRDGALMIAACMVSVAAVALGFGLLGSGGA